MDSEATEANLGYQLAENFIFFQDIVKKPEEVFDCRSQEYKLANAWLNKLSMLGLETTDDMRLRNVYMSHLVACLNYGKLTGPFTSMPNPDGGLDKSDFQTREKAKQAVCPRPQPSKTASQKACLLSKGGGGTECECDYVCCGKNEQKNDYSSSVGPNSTFDNICGYVMQYVNVPTCLDSQLCGTVAHAPYHTHDVFTNCADAAAATTSAAFYGPKMGATCVGGAYAASNCATCGESVEFDHQVVRGQIMTLLDAIASELRGEQTPGANDYLEYELARYKNFKLQFPQVAEKITKLKAEQSLRSYFLLNLQNDLVKLLNDCCLQPETNMRRTYDMH